MKTQGEHIRTLRRRVDFLKARDYRNSYDQAELGALEWALVNLPPAQRQWVGLTDEEVYPLANEHLHHQMEGYEVSGIYNLARAIEARLKELNT
jgi:hypothetical protein